MCRSQIRKIKFNGFTVYILVMPDHVMMVLHMYHDHVHLNYL